VNQTARMALLATMPVVSGLVSATDGHGRGGGLAGGRGGIPASGGSAGGRGGISTGGRGGGSASL
jgi:hypothetical protein